MSTTQARRCHGVVDILSDYLDGYLSLVDRLRIRFHLAMCPKCTAYFRQFRTVYEATGRVRPEDLPEDFDRVMAEVLQRWKQGA